ncbi:MAG: hypothetical protein LKF53_02705 [Solobacterium sp.]|nr:hypothetical protein [Solobacterium sp.]MCH4205289.1 hypothetical protein [Solobacterium sp.]MCH4226882.1 hypothetical protein [Solobacterium sp.]MCH4281642.1 hypothetical protein [Solobacterium sp.]
MAANDERIILGSADVYIKLLADGALPTIEDLCKDENRLAYISGGASIDYKPTYYTAEDDRGIVVKKILTKEEVTLKTGICTWNGNKIKYLSDTATVTTDADKKLRVVKVGGIKNYKGQTYAICLHHVDAIDGDIWVMIAGSSESGFSLKFDPAKETTCDAEFKAAPQDENGTLITYQEETK